MKLIQILALTTAMAAAAAGQTTGATNTKPVGKKSGTAPAKVPVVVAHPVSRKTAARRKATGSKSAHTAGKTAGKRVAAPGAKRKSGATAAKPVVSVGSLPAKKKAGAARSKHVRAVQAKRAKSPVKAKPVTKAAARPVTKAGAKPKVGAATAKQHRARHTGSERRPSRPSVAKVEGAPKPHQKLRTPAKLLGAAGRRDPFVSPIRSASAVAPTSSCTSGKRCLSIPELVLQGTVRDISGKMLAVVSTSNRRTYTLRENDQVFNGSVEKITSDSIIFREYVRDPLGRESAREVVKKMGPTS